MSLEAQLDVNCDQATKAKRALLRAFNSFSIHLDALIPQMEAAVAVIDKKQTADMELQVSYIDILCGEGLLPLTSGSTVLETLRDVIDFGCHSNQCSGFTSVTKKPLFSRVRVLTASVTKKPTTNIGAKQDPYQEEPPTR